MFNPLNSEDLQLISVSYNLGLKNGQQKSGFFSWPFSKPDSTYIEKIADAIIIHTRNNPNSIIALALQEHTGWTSTGFQTRLLEAINSKLDNNNSDVDAKKTFTLQEGTNQEKASFRAITKPHNPKSWQGTFIFAPTKVNISGLAHKHYRADHNQGKGGVTSTFTATYSTKSEDSSVKHSIPLTFHGAHLSSDKKDGAYRRNLELMNMVPHFPTGEFLDYAALKQKAHDYSYRFLLGDLNYRDNQLLISDDTNSPTSCSSTKSENTANTDATPSDKSISPLEDDNSNIDRVILDSNGFTTQIPNQKCSYQKSCEIRAQTKKRPSQNTSSLVKTNEVSILDDTASETSNSSEEQRVERDTGSLDLMVTLGGTASKIKIQESEYIESEKNPSDHKALVACSSVKHQDRNDFDNVKSMVTSELTNYGKVIGTSDEFSGVKQYIDSLKNTQENRNHLVALFHLYRSIQDIRLQEHLLELALNPSETITQSSSFFSWLPSWTSWQTTEEITPAEYQDISKIKISGTLLEQANNYFNGEQSTERGKDVTIQILTQEMNNTLDYHWDRETHLSREINTSWTDSLYKMLSLLCSCVFSQSPKAKPEPRTTENKLRALRITDFPSDESANLEPLKLHGLFVRKAPEEVTLTNSTKAGNTETGHDTKETRAFCPFM